VLSANEVRYFVHCGAKDLGAGGPASNGSTSARYRLLTPWQPKAVKMAGTQKRLAAHVGPGTSVLPSMSASTFTLSTMTLTPAFNAAGGAPDDEVFWGRMRDAFPRRPGPINLLNSGGGRSPQHVVDRLKDLLQIMAAGDEKLDPVLCEHTESGSSPVVRRLFADAFGCGAWVYS
jgi:hypothetical protein